MSASRPAIPEDFPLRWLSLVPEPDISPCVADFARLFHQKGIPSLLWGPLAVSLYLGKAELLRANWSGFFSWKNKVQFVIPDDQADVAVNSINQDGLIACTDPKCTFRQYEESASAPDPELVTIVPYLPLPMAVLGQRHVHAVTAAHFHIEDRYPDVTILALYKQSRTLLCPLEIPVNKPADGDRNFMTSNDPWTKRNDISGMYFKRGDEYPVVILTPLAYCEALIMLVCKDKGHRQRLDQKWRKLLLCLAWSFGEELKNCIDPRFAPLLEGVMQMRQDRLNKNANWRRDRLGEAVDQLREELIQENMLDNLLPHERLLREETSSSDLV